MGSMVRRDILSRYRGSFGGTLWTFLNPLLLMATYFFVFGVVLRTKFGADTSRTGFVLYFLAGMLPWLAFSEAVGRAPYVILEYRSFVKKIVFPLETLPVNLVISGAVTEAFGLVIFTIGLLAVRGAIPASVLWLPLLLIPQILFTAGLAWILAATGVYVRDLGQVTGYLLTLWFFLTPICYPESSLPASAVPILRFNPLFVLVRAYRAVFLENQAPSVRGLLGLWIVSGGGRGDRIRLVPPSAQELRGCDLVRYRVVSLASLDLVILVRHLEVEFPVGPVLFRVGRRVRDRVLAAHLVLDFLEDVVETVLAVHFEHPAAGFIRYLLQLAFSPAAAEHEAAATIGAGIAVVNAVDHRVRQLGLANGLVSGLAAALIDAVGDHHDDLAARFALEALIRGQVDRVPQHRAGLVLRRRDRSRMQPADSGRSSAAVSTRLPEAWANWSNPAAARNPCRS